MSYQPRGHSRFEIAGWVLVTPAAQGDPQVLKCDLVNISFKGCLLLASQFVQCGTAVDFDLTTELLSEHIRGQGIIRHARELNRGGKTVFALGVEFTCASKEGLVSLFNVYHARANQEKHVVNKPKTKYEGPF